MTVAVNLGRLLITPAADEAIPADEISHALSRHVAGDWGDVCEIDWATNDNALGERHRVLSSYKTASGEPFWIITEADRLSTTVLLPNDY